MNAIERHLWILETARQLYVGMLTSSQIQWVNDTPVFPRGMSSHEPLQLWAWNQAERLYKAWNTIPGNEDKR
jgi:hypothetical protein